MITQDELTSFVKKSKKRKSHAYRDIINTTNSLFKERIG
jgi:hypothetical protein